jgi:choline dehydrogenase-like flavoprotein
MLIDARSLPTGTTLDTEVCIIGAGAAGISLAREFAGAKFRVMLLEGGGLKFEHRSQFLHRGVSSGRPYRPLEGTHRRQFGGTTAVWFGRCRPLDAVDFEARSWLPNSGWPIARSDLAPYYERAGALCEIGSSSDEAAIPLPKESGLEGKLYHFSPPTHFGQKYLPALLSATNIRVLIHANATRLDSGSEGGTGTSIQCKTLNGKNLAVAARLFILAGGGLENPRLLLNSRDVHGVGLGNAHDLVGRFFMEHVGTFIAAVTAIPAEFPRQYLRLDYQTFQRNLQPTAAAGLPERRLREEQLLNARAFLVRRPRYKLDDRFHSARMRGFINVVEMLEHRRPPSRAFFGNLRHTVQNSPTVLRSVSMALQGKLAAETLYGVELQSETAPNRDSRLTLTEQVDALGTPRVRLEWKLSTQDLDSFQRVRAHLLRGLGKCGVTTRKFQHDLDADGWPVAVAASSHHMGTTRMSQNPQLGVVDADCRIHGISNVYVAGSSVFPTCGMANPTLTIVALAIRLADHIKQVLG